ncbi:MAG: hypothetical protein KBD03_04905 [Gammaproteobacteria bacterium]|nr:hypothetical protein [Gammaproteobacteria bacterium]
MNSEHLFKVALGIENPWEVVGVSFKDKEGESAKELHIDIDFVRREVAC